MVFGIDDPRESGTAEHESHETGLSFLHLSADMPLQRNAELLQPAENGLLKGIKNTTAVYAELLPGIPGAVASRIADDCSREPLSTAAKFAESAAIGFGTALLLARSPALTKVLLSTAGIGASAIMLSDTARFTGAAFSADNAETRSRLSASGLASIGKLGANLLETAPAFVLGTGSGFMLSSRIGALDSLATAVQNAGEYRLRRVLPENFHYMSLDAKTIAGLGENGELNLLKAGEEMSLRTPWRGVEDGRFFKTSANGLKMSARLPGTEFETIMGRRADSMFHTHADRVLPTSSDFNSVYNTGVIGVPRRGIVTFYEGTGKEAQELAALVRAGKLSESEQAVSAFHERRFSSLVLDPSRELSVRVDLRWNAARRGLEPSSIQTLDFADTVKNLSKWNGRLKISSIESSAEALLKPGMSDLLKKISSDSF